MKTKERITKNKTAAQTQKKKMNLKIEKVITVIKSAKKSVKIAIVCVLAVAVASSVMLLNKGMYLR